MIRRTNEWPACTGRSKRKGVVVAIYIRKSRKDKDKVSHRLAFQRESLPEYARSQGWEYEVYDDDHASASRKNIGELHERARLEADIRAGKIDIVLVIELSRLSRDDSMQDYVAWLTLCATNGVKLAVQSRILDPADRNDWLMLIIEGGFLSAEMKQTAARMREGFDKAFRSGHFLGGVPPAPYKLSGRRQTPIVDKDELIRMQCLWKMAEKISARAIADELGMPEIAVRRAIRDDRLLFYQALRIHPETGELFHCNWEPVMDSAQAERIRAARRTRKNGDAKRGEPASLLTNLGLFFCGYCGRPIKIHYNSKKRRDGSRLYYYGCQSGCDGSRMIAQPIANKKVTRNLFGTLANLDQLKKYWLLEQNRKDSSEEIKELLAQQQSQESEMQNLVEAIAKRIITEANAHKKSAAINATLQEIEKRLQELSSFKSDEPDWEALSFRQNDFDRLNLSDQRLLIRAAIERVAMYDSYFIVTYHFPRTAEGDCTSRIHLPPPQRGTAAGRLPRIL